MEKAPRKKRERKPTTSVRTVPGTYDPNWWNYPPEWDVQNEALQNEYKKRNNKQT